MGIVILIVLGLVFVGWAATFALIGSLKRHYPALYAEIGEPTRWGLFMDGNAGWFARKSIKNFKRFLYRFEFRHLDRLEVRALGWTATSCGVLAVALIVGALIADKL